MPDVRMAGFRPPFARPDTPWLTTALGPCAERSWQAIGTKETKDLQKDSTYGEVNTPVQRNSYQGISS